MPRLYGHDVDWGRLAELTAGAGAHVGNRLVELADGPGRGVRVIEVRTGGGLAFEIVVDRGFDLGEARFADVPFAWASATGYRAPALNDPFEEDGLGLLRGYTGLMTTCGYDHVGGPMVADGRHFHYPRRERVPQPLHGRAPHLPARLLGHGVDRAAGVVWAEGEVTQATVFGENLVLRRRITAPIGGARVVVEDRLRNAGFAETPVMMLYHVNLGWPLIAPGARIEAPVARTLWTSHDPGAGGPAWNDVSEPAWPFVEQVWEHEIVPEDGMHHVTVRNCALRDGSGLAVRVSARADTLPCFLEWQAYSKGLYALGLEPATNHAAGRSVAAERGELIHLRAGEERTYRVEIAVI